MKKRMTAALSILICCAATAPLAGCGLFSASVADDSYPSDVASDAGAYGSAQSWLAAQETPSTYERRLYDEAVAAGYAGTYYEFLLEQGLSSEDDTAYINRALLSAVAVEVSYTTSSGRLSSTSTSDGTGIIYRLDETTGEAYVVTNYHVVAHATGASALNPSPLTGVSTAWSDIVLTLYGGEVISPTQGDTVTFVGGGNVLGASVQPSYDKGENALVYEGTDIAVLRVVSDKLKDGAALAAQMAQPTAGEEAYAVGNAEGEGISVTRGVVSRLSEQITVSAANEVARISFAALRTDAAINHGNSGGGLFNERGELLGIVTARKETAANSSTSVDGFGYAIACADVNAALAVFGGGEIAAAASAGESTQRVLLDRSAAAARAASSVVTVMGDEGEGSGVIYDLDKQAGDAYIVTNYHVIYSSASGVSKQMQVYLSEDTAESAPIRASFAGGVMEEDIAVLRIEGSSVLAASGAQEVLAADSSSLTVGEDVYAIGNAGGAGVAFTSGIVSVLREYIHVAAADDKSTLTMAGIRIDAVVNHGNSGGGLFNEMGELIGIVNARSEEEGVEAFGYAIPANRALLIAQNILDNSASEGAALASLGGVTLQTYRSRALFHEETGKAYLEEKVTVRGIPSGSIGARMGLDVNDTLVSARIEREGETAYAAHITRSDRLGEMLYAVRLGDTLHITVSRRGIPQEFSYTFSSARDFTEVL